MNREKIPQEKPAAFFAKISGRVQGVGYRYSTAEEAQRLNLKGWVRNTYEGTVEVWAEGEDEKLVDFLKWLCRGPALSRVDSVQKEDTEASGYREFKLRY